MFDSQETDWSEMAYLALVDGFVAPAYFQRGTEVSIADGVTLVKSRSKLNWYNAAFRTDEQLDGKQLVDRAAKFFNDPGWGYKIYARQGVDDDLAEACQNASLVIGDENTPCMVIDRAVNEVDVPQWLTIDTTPSEKLALDFADVACSAFADDDESKVATRDVLAPEEIFTPISKTFVGYVDGEAAGAVNYWMSRSVFGVYWVSTKPEFRRRGIADLMTRVATNDAFANGARLATLTSSKLGQGIYERIGYRKVSAFDTFTAHFASSTPLSQ